MEDFDTSKSAGNDRWNPTPKEEVLFKTEENGQLTIFWDDSVEPPDPNDFQTLEEFEAAWQHGSNGKT